jgi:hypothetical protein
MAARHCGKRGILDRGRPERCGFDLQARRGRRRGLRGRPVHRRRHRQQEQEMGLLVPLQRRPLRDGGAEAALAEGLGGGATDGLVELRIACSDDSHPEASPQVNRGRRGGTGGGAGLLNAGPTHRAVAGCRGPTTSRSSRAQPTSGSNPGQPKRATRRDSGLGIGQSKRRPPSRGDLGQNGRVAPVMSPRFKRRGFHALRGAASHIRDGRC